MITIDNIYAAINPLPAMLTHKGKVNPKVTFSIEANAGFSISVSWKKPYSDHDWENQYECFLGIDFATALSKATAFIEGLPTAQQAKLNHFMGRLGRLIDAGNSDGIEVEYLNPLLDTMKKLSENAITFQPGRSPQATETPP